MNENISQMLSAALQSLEAAKEIDCHKIKPIRVLESTPVLGYN